MTREEHTEKINEIIRENRAIKAIISTQNDKLNKLSNMCDDAKEAYQRGLEDAWELARRIRLNVEDGGISVSELCEMFHTNTTYNIFKGYSAQEVIKRIEEHEKQKTQIKKGDEVALRDEDRKAVIMDAAYGTSDWYVFSDNACIERWSECAFYRTGRTFPQVKEMFKAMQEGADNEKEKAD